MCGYFPIGFTTFMLNNKTLTDFTNLFSPNKFENWSINTWVFSITIKWKKIYCIKCNKQWKFGNSQI